MNWDGTTIARLTQYVAQGMTSTEVERLMPGFTRNAIVSKARKLDLKWVGSPLNGVVKSRLEFPPEQRAEVIAMLRNGIGPSTVSDRLRVSYDRVLRLMEEEQIPRPPKRTSLGRPRGRGEPPLPPIPQPQRSAMVADVRQVALLMPAVPRLEPEVAKVVPFPVRQASRECFWTSGERGSWVHCCEPRVKGPFCAEHAKRGFVRSGVGEAAD